MSCPVHSSSRRWRMSFPPGAQDIRRRQDPGLPAFRRFHHRPPVPILWPVQTSFALIFPSLSNDSMNSPFYLYQNRCFYPGTLVGFTNPAIKYPKKKKHEIRNSKQIQNSNFQCSKRVGIPSKIVFIGNHGTRCALFFGHSVLENSKLFRISSFDIRI